MTATKKTKAEKPAKPARVKTKFTTDMTAHVWAQRSQSCGETKGGSLRFDCDVLCAYYTVVAILVTDKDGETRAVQRAHVRCSGFAPNYGSIAWNAARQYPRHMVADLDSFYHATDARLDCKDESTKAKLAKLLEGKIGGFRETVTHMSNVNKGKDWITPERRAEWIDAALNECENFADAFGLPFEIIPLSEEADKAKAYIRAAIEERDRKANDPATIAKRDKARATKEKRASRFDAEFEAWNEHGLKPPPFSAYMEGHSNNQRSYVKQTLERDASALRYQRRPWGLEDEGTSPEYVPAYAWNFTRPLRVHSERVESARDIMDTFIRYGECWRAKAEDVKGAIPIVWSELDAEGREKITAGLSQSIYNKKNPPEKPLPKWDAPKRLTPEQWLNGEGGASQYHFERTYVRRKGSRLETSRGAEAPFAQAVAIFLRAQRCVLERKGWRANGEQFEAGFFKLESIDALGTIRIGCHLIEFQEMLALALREIPERVVSFPLALAA